jgi:hypothetical protein
MLLNLLKKIRPYKDRIVLNTNGSLLTPERVNILNDLIDELQVSIHHFNENKHSEILGRNISFEEIKNSLINRKFMFSINSTFNNSYNDEEKPIAVEKMIELSNWFKADRLRLTELKKVDDSNFIAANEFFESNNPVIGYSSDELITKGCTYYFTKNNIDVSVKRLCKYAKGKNAPAFSCCFINTIGQNKIDVETKDTFKVIYSDGLVTDDWIFDKI